VPLEKRIERGPRQGAGLRRVEHRHVRVQAERVGVAADQIQAEAVQRGELRHVQQRELRLPPLRLRSIAPLQHLPAAPPQRLAEALPHLGRRRVRERHDQQPVQRLARLE
jgi:hypothetical protein